MEEITYQSFLLKLWLVRQNGKLVWLASLENPHTGNKINFNCFDKLFAFLKNLKDEQESLGKGS